MRQLLIGALGTAILLTVTAMLYAWLGASVSSGLAVSVQAPTPALTLMHGASQDISFLVSVDALAACDVTCDARFASLSAGTSTTKQLSMRDGQQEELRVTVRNDRPGIGQDVYRMQVTCMTVQSARCAPSGERTAAAIVTVERIRSPDALQRRAANGEQLRADAAMLADQEGRTTALADTIDALHVDTPTDLGAQLTLLRTAQQEHVAQLRALLPAWDADDYDTLETALRTLTPDIMEHEQQIVALTAQLTAMLEERDARLQQLTMLRARILQLPWRWAPQYRASTAGSYETIMALVQSNASAMTKQRSLTALDTFLRELERDTAQRAQRDAWRMSFANSVIAAVACDIRGCNASISILDDEASACAHAIAVHATLADVNRTIPSDNTTLATLDALLANTTAEIVLSLPANDTRRDAFPNATPTVRPPVPAAMEAPLLAALATRVELCPAPADPPTLTALTTETIRIGVPPVVEPLVFPDAPRQCCYAGVCAACCAGCQHPPVIFVHGHAFNREDPATSSFDTFRSIRNLLETHGYVDAGALTPGQAAPAQLGWNASALFSASYYFAQRDMERIQAKRDGIDTYAIRLRTLVEQARAQTGQDRVVLVAHSMGGLVARRYVQLFGTDHVALIVTIGTPHHGVQDTPDVLCPVIGARAECEDMRAGSVFLASLPPTAPPVPTLNIIGTGCPMQGGQGDGVVREESATLDGAQEFRVVGTCDGTRILHMTLLEMAQYPIVGERILAALP